MGSSDFDLTHLKHQMLVDNKMFIVWPFWLFFFQACNQSMGITEDLCPGISQAEHGLYRLQIQVI